MINLKLIERQPHWRVAALHFIARVLGVMFHVEGIPFGSNRNHRRWPTESASNGEGVSNPYVIVGDQAGRIT